MLTFAVAYLKRAIDKAESEEQAVLDLLQRNMARLQRVRKQRDLLRRRGSLMISKKAQTVEDLEELDRLEAVRASAEEETADSFPPSKRRAFGDPSASDAPSVSRLVGELASGSEAFLSPLAPSDSLALGPSLLENVDWSQLNSGEIPESSTVAGS